MSSDKEKTNEQILEDLIQAFSSDYLVQHSSGPPSSVLEMKKPESGLLVFVHSFFLYR
jgi:hypothetical protein